MAGGRRGRQGVEFGPRFLRPVDQVERRELFATSGTHHLTTTLTLVPKAQLEVCEGVLHEL